MICKALVGKPQFMSRLDSRSHGLRVIRVESGPAMLHYKINKRYFQANGLMQ
jgi:hypothetical protein